MSAREQCDIEMAARAIIKALDRVTKRRPMEPTKLLGALGAAGAFVTAAALPTCDEAADAVAIGMMGAGFVEMLPTIRKAGSN